MNKIVNILENILESDDFKKSKNFVEDDIIDSLDIFTLTEQLENTFQIQIKGSDIVPENFISIDSIENLVNKYLEKINEWLLKQNICF